MRIKKQQEQKDCGLVCLQGFFYYFYKQWISINELRKNANFSENGLNLVELKNLANKYGIKLQILQGDFQSFLNWKIDQKMILLLNNNNIFHYVILENKDDKFITYTDPQKGKITETISEFEKNTLILL
ncbi:cysteine peptidase family C39 domain-containing protein [[Mycoplasma] gypis]|uniref:Cysteine peptidase family C39 domain-containing protein n=1 Tax=[Mycoplasma] gypis TaxID=92404 RepID=A0ABZ2RP28_9BACT|nr:cysteine peptidase family C39 domain-containing protein [[Mycoplasma] gypis]MBN0919133.1 hypothetical protein [[Mycoplasma] gypis]